jgi:hypothetical protein
MNDEPSHTGAGEAVRDRRDPWWMGKWFQPVFAIGLGVVFWAAFWVGGDFPSGLISFTILAAFGTMLAVGGRSDALRGMRGDGRDERWATIDLRAGALTGQVLIAVIVIAFVIEITQGNSGNPYMWLGAVAGLTYLGGLVIGRIRS